MINFQQCRCQGTYFPFWGAKRFCGRFPDHFFKVVFQFLNSFFFFPDSVSFEVLSHSKGLGAK